MATLAGCGSEPAPAPQQQPAPREQATKDADKLILCATGDAALESRCTVELDKRPDGPIVTVRNPDGGFHRLQASRDGRTLEAADGAQPAILKIINDNTVEVAIGADRYRLPADLARR